MFAHGFIVSIASFPIFKCCSVWDLFQLIAEVLFFASKMVPCLGSICGQSHPLCSDWKMLFIPDRFLMVEAGIFLCLTAFAAHSSVAKQRLLLRDGHGHSASRRHGLAWPSSQNLVVRALLCIFLEILPQ